jgi:hypothetical protein
MSAIAPPSAHHRLTVIIAVLVLALDLMFTQPWTEDWGFAVDIQCGASYLRVTQHPANRILLRWRRVAPVIG